MEPVLEKGLEELLETLKTAGQSGKIELSDVQNYIAMLTKKNILSNHKYSIFEGKDGKWRTHVPDATKSDGRRLIKRNTREALEDAIVEAYRKNEKTIDPTLAKLYPLWMEHYKAKTESMNTVKRAVATWNKYYAKDADLISKPIRLMHSTDIETWIHNKIKAEAMDKKKYYNMSMPFRQILDFGYRSGIISYNPFAHAQINKKLLVKKRKPEAKTQVYTEAEEFFLMRLAWEEWKEDNSLGACLALILLFYTGLRIGEVVALKRSDIDGLVAHICRSEVEVSVQIDETTFKQIGHMVIDHPKTSAGFRDVYLTHGGREVVDAALSGVAARGADDRYLFTNGITRVNVDMVTYRLKKYCNILGIPFRSAHKIRKTYVSHLIDGGVNIDAARIQVGHEDERTTLRCYTFNTKTQDETNEQFERALSTLAPNPGILVTANGYR